MHLAHSKLAIVCPMANEAECAVRFVVDVLQECRRYAFRDIEFVAVLDTASQDGTLELLQSLAEVTRELRVVFAPENRGVVDAYLRGYREALAHGADWILEMDAGYSHMPAEIPRFLDCAGQDWDCVVASRFTRGGVYGGGLSRRFVVSRLGSWTARILLGIRLGDLTSGFTLFSRASLERIVKQGVRSRGPFFQTEIKVSIGGLRIKEVPITYVPTGQVARPAALWDAIRVLLLLFFERIGAIAWRAS